jgi:hypothetical protein
MEIDYSASDVCKEGGDGAFVEAGEPTARTLAESPVQIDEGQWPISG